MEIGHLSLMDESKLASKLVITRRDLRQYAHHYDNGSKSFQELYEKYCRAQFEAHGFLASCGDLVRNFNEDRTREDAPDGRVALSAVGVEVAIEDQSRKIEDSLERWYYRTVVPRGVAFPAKLEKYEVYLFAMIFARRDEWDSLMSGGSSSRLAKHLAEGYSVTAVTYSFMKDLNIEQSITIVDGEASPFTATGLLMTRDAYDWISEVCPNWSKVVRAIQASILILEK